MPMQALVAASALKHHPHQHPIAVSTADPPTSMAAGGGGGGDIGADSERRLKKAMDKLYHFPKPKANAPGGSKPSSSSAPAPSSGRPVGKAAAEAARRFGVVRGSRLPPQVAAMAAISPPPPCRPWDRADLMRRLGTFKAMTWFAKPKVISPVNCARRGWTNIEPDVITCEACGARLMFSTPSSWSTQQVEKAAAVFSLKLDSGHKLLCPWIDNTCDESLALFPPTTPPVLVENYYECFSSLLRLLALPRISCSSLETMKKRSPQLEQFLSEPLSSSVVLKGRFMLTEDSTIKDLDDAFQDADTYYQQALKIISLCGWEPRLLPYAIDCGTESHSDASSISKMVQPQQISKTMEDRVILYSPNDANGARASADANREDQHYDPLSAVLDCQFCGACVALWPFSLVERPLQLFKLISDSNRQDDQDNGHDSVVSGVGHSKDANIGFNFTIAGGPPPTRQSFRPKVSFPVVSRHLKADLNSRGNLLSSGSHSHMVPVASNASGSMKRKRSTDQPHLLEGDIDDVDTSTIGAKHDQPGDNSEKSIPNSEVSTEQKQGGSHSDTDKDTNMDGASNEEEPATGSPSRKSITSTDEALDQHGLEPRFPSVQGMNEEPSNGVNLAETDANNSMPNELSTRTKSLVNKEKGAYRSSEKQGLYDRMNEFDPIKQHRTFCPWISPDYGESLPGWRLTLTALLAQDRRSDEDSQGEVQTGLLDEDDDPLTSVRKLFMSPPPKRRRIHQSEKS
ncbi:hypothetical protein SEVIR_5G225200v4 [Setaria viridis]|uniref:C3HC-type domain-containing protein n=1 Tax=Setaria viridis TaxID=4556 RepID=A0A4U6ULT9_SETVI|nr:uncharacterized protein LOC117857670 isoform X1 [Setaria viridis]TKW15253.1 hypothetical protein SEVIR_5G225200v2 [Setaria viridis]